MVRLAIVNSRLTDLEGLFSKGLLRKEILLNQQIEKSLVEGQISNLEAQVARLRQNLGDLDVRLGDVRASYLRQILAELQDTSQRLREVETSLGPTRRLLLVKAQAAGSNGDDAEYTIHISRVRDGAMVTFDATKETMLSPGDVVEVKLKRRVPDSRALSFDPGDPGSEHIRCPRQPSHFQVGRRWRWATVARVGLER